MKIKCMSVMIAILTAASGFISISHAEGEYTTRSTEEKELNATLNEMPLDKDDDKEIQEEEYDEEKVDEDA